MECRDVREMADSFLAQELLTETNHEILRHLETCRACRADLDARRRLRDGVRAAFHNASELRPTPEFTAQLRAHLETAARRQATPRAMRFIGWWALAAVVVLAVAIGVAYRGREWGTIGDALVRAAVGDHRNCALQFRLAEKPIPLAEAARRYGAVYRVLETLPLDDIVTVRGRAHVLERHSCVYAGRRFAHIVLEYRGERVSLLVTAAEGSAASSIRTNALPHVTPAGRIDGMSVVFFRASRQMVFLTGAVEQADLVALGDAVAGPLSRGLTGASATREPGEPMTVGAPGA